MANVHICAAHKSEHKMATLEIVVRASADGTITTNNGEMEWWSQGTRSQKLQQQQKRPR